MLSENVRVVKGMRLHYIPTGQDFTVLCSCPNSRPVQYTTRFIKQHRDNYGLPRSKDKAQ